MTTFKNKDFTIQYRGKTYQVHISRRKKMKNIYFRLDNKIINVSCNHFVSKKRILFQLNSLMPELIAKDDIKTSIKYFDDNGIYLFGEYVPFDDKFVKIFGHYILFTNLEDFYKRVKKIVYPYYLKILQKGEEIVSSKINHELKLRYVKGYYAVNHLKKHIVTFNLLTMHYSEEIILSIAIHELAHDKFRLHGREFYNEVLKYCPNYFELDRKLKKGVFK